MYISFTLQLFGKHAPQMIFPIDYNAINDDKHYNFICCITQVWVAELHMHYYP
jgi:hypothetical protein